MDNGDQNKMAILTDEDIAKFDGQNKQAKVLTDDDIASFDEQASSRQQANQKKGMGEVVADSITRIPGVYYESGKKLVGGVAHALANPVETAKGVAHAVTHPIDTAKAFVKDRYDTPENAMKTLANDPFGVISDASLATGGAGVVLKATGQANKVASVAKVGQAMTDASTVPLQAAGKAVSPVVKGVEDILKGTPDTMRDLSGRMHNMVVRMPVKSFKYGKDPLKVMQKESITANTITEYADLSEQRLAQRTAELHQAVAESKDVLNLQSVVSDRIKTATSEAKGSLKKSVRETVAAKIDDLKDSIHEKYGDLSGISLQDAVKLKRQLADDFPFTGNVEDDIVAKAAHKIHHDINKSIDKAAPQIADLNESVSSLIDISKAAKQRMAVEARNNPIGLIGTILGTAVGGYTGGVSGAGAGLTLALGLKVASSPAALTRVANSLSKMADIDKVSLFKAAPWFKKVAQKAQTQHPELEVVNIKSLPTPTKPVRRTDRMLPSPRVAGQSSGPVIKMGGDFERPPVGLPFYTTDVHGRVKGTNFVMGEKKLRPQDVNDELIMAEKPKSLVDDLDIIAKEDEQAYIQIRAEIAQEELKALEKARKYLRRSIKKEEFSKGEFQDMKRKLAWAASPTGSSRGMDLDTRASEFFRLNPQFYPKDFQGRPADALAVVLKDLTENRGPQYMDELRGVIKSAKKKTRRKANLPH